MASLPSWPKAPTARRHMSMSKSRGGTVRAVTVAETARAVVAARAAGAVAGAVARAAGVAVAGAADVAAAGAERERPAAASAAGSARGASGGRVVGTCRGRVQDRAAGESGAPEAAWAHRGCCCCCHPRCRGHCHLRDRQTEVDVRLAPGQRVRHGWCRHERRCHGRCRRRCRRRHCRDCDRRPCDDSARERAARALKHPAEGAHEGACGSPHRLCRAIRRRHRRSEACRRALDAPRSAHRSSVGRRCDRRPEGPACRPDRWWRVGRAEHLIEHPRPRPRRCSPGC